MKDVIRLLDRSISYHRCFAAISGSVTGGVLLSQAVYWSNRTKDPDGWFYKTQEQWHEETYLSRREQETARRRLREIGVLEEKKEGVPCQLFYRVNRERLNRLLCEFASDDSVSDGSDKDDANRTARNSQTSMPESDQPVWPNRADWDGRIVQASVAESAKHSISIDDNIDDFIDDTETREPVKQKILDPIPRQMDPEPTPLRRDPSSWRKYLDPDRPVMSTTLPTPWRIRDQNQQLKNHPGFVEFLQSQYEGKISMAVGFLTNARKDPDKNEAAHELWDHYIKSNSSEAATVAGIDPLDAFPHKDEWLDYIEANGRMQFELNYPGGTKRERMQFTDILIENEKRAKQEQK